MAGGVIGRLVTRATARDKRRMRAVSIVAALLGYALPPRCPGCGGVVEADHRFCATCWDRLHLLTGEGCALCNLPMAHAAGSICAPCLAVPPRHDGVFAAVVYGDIARDVALRLKHGRQTGLARTMATLMARHAVADAILVPVPLHRWRLWRRGFNQSALIAAAIARRTGQSVIPDMLQRVRATPMLRGLSPRARADAVRGVFRTTSRIDGKTVMLVDDVHTSGATANACAAALKRAGAARVIVLCWARVLRED